MLIPRVLRISIPCQHTSRFSPDDNSPLRPHHNASYLLWKPATPGLALVYYWSFVMSQRCSTLPHSPEMVSPVEPNDPREASPEVALAAPQWQRLASMDGKSPDFLPLLSSLTSQGNRSLTTNLRGTEASITLNAMDQVSLAFFCERCNLPYTPFSAFSGW